MLGIGGTGMGSLAGLLVEAGHKVSGTDIKLYPPMSDQLSALGITPFEGYSPSNLGKINPELVIIGNVIRRENEEAQEILRRKIPFKSMPQTLGDLFLTGRTPLVVAGTHGKTTSSTLAAWLLSQAGERPGFLIGGVGLNFGKSFSCGKGPFFVVEGDEYDTAFFDKGPKFLHYRPQALLITSIEFDHADIYKDLDQIMTSFRRLVKIMPEDGLIVANVDDKNVAHVLDGAHCRIVTYGLKKGNYVPNSIKVDELGTHFSIGEKSNFSLPMWGEHNLSNAVGVIAILHESRIPFEKISDGMPSFKGIKRRQEVVCEAKGVTIIDDFAHHPTAVAKTIEAMRLKYPGRRLWAIFEPRSNTSRRNIFQSDFIKSLSLADRVIIASPFKSDAIPEKERFDSDTVANTIMQMGKDAYHIPDTAHIVEYVMRGVDYGDVILVMSNGGFDGLPGKLEAELKKRRIVDENGHIVSAKAP